MIFAKKGQGLPMNIIIIAALFIVVLIVMIIVFSDRVKIFSSGLDSCPGECKAKCGEGEAKVPNEACTQACCITVIDSS